MHFEAAAQFRLSIDDLEKSRYGEEIARLRVAEGLTKKGLDAGKRGVAESVLSDLKVSVSRARRRSEADTQHLLEPASRGQECTRTSCPG